MSKRCRASSSSRTKNVPLFLHIQVATMEQKDGGIFVDDVKQLKSNSASIASKFTGMESSKFDVEVSPSNAIMQIVGRL